MPVVCICVVLISTMVYGFVFAVYVSWHRFFYMPFVDIVNQFNPVLGDF